MKWLDPQNHSNQARFLRFLIVGGSTAAVQFIVLAITQHSFRPTISFSIAYVAAIAVHYLLNSHWALRSSRTDRLKQISEYLLVAALSYAINLSIYQCCISLLGLSTMLAAITAFPPTTIIVFILLNIRVFRAKAGI